MLKILDRYIFSELMTPFFLSVSALCFVLFSNQLPFLVELLFAKGVGLLTVLKVVLHLMPSFLVLTLPIAGLIASITAFSRLSYDKELVAMQAAGLSLLRLSRPVLVFSILVCGLTLYLSQWGQPWTSISMKTLAMSMLKDQLTLSLDKGVFNEPIPHMVIYVSDALGHDQPGGIFIADERIPGKARLIVAATYLILNDPVTKSIGLRLTNGTIHNQPHDLEEYQQVTFSTYDLKLPVDQRLSAPAAERQSREAVLAELERTNWQDTASLRRLMEYDKDLAFPVAALELGLLGVPIGIVSKRSGRTGGFAAGVLIIIIFFVLNVLGEHLVTTRVLLPFAGAWLPNLATGLATIVAFWRTSRA